MLPDVGSLSLAEPRSIPQLHQLHLITSTEVDKSAETTNPVMKVIEPYANDLVDMSPGNPFIEWSDALKAAQLIEKQSKESTPVDIWFNIKREELGCGIRIICNKNKKEWYLVPKAIEKTEAKGSHKRGRKALLLSFDKGEWKAKVVWYLRPIDVDTSDKFLKARGIEERIANVFKDDKSNPFVQLIGDFNIEKSNGSDKWVERRAFYHYASKELFNELPKMGDSIKIQVAYGLVKAVQKMHLKNIVCRDLKPENILLDNLEPKFCDMDFVVDEEMVSELKSDDIAGTSYYIAPEFAKVIRGEAVKPPTGLKALKANDIFALGCTLNLLCASGKDVPWFKEESEDAVIGYQKARDHFTKKIYPLKSILVSKSKKIDPLERVRHLSLWMLNGSANHRPTAEQAMDVVKKI